MTEPRATYDAGQPSAQDIANLEWIKLIIIEDLIDMAEEAGRIRVDLETGDVRWLIAKIKDLQMQVTQLADLLAVEAGVEGEK